MADNLDLDAVEDDETGDVEAKSSRTWLARIAQAEKTFADYQARADDIDKLYANADRLARNTRDREFQLFWANIQVLGPSIYSKPPVPVVVPRFKDRRPLYRISSEMLERATTVAFELSAIDRVMRLVRDDLTVQGRGVPWVRYETKSESDRDIEQVCFEHKDRKDFLHEPSRNWSEVGWVAGAAYLSKKQMRKRFGKTSGKAYQNVEYAIQRDAKDIGADDGRRKAKVWEIWSKDDARVYWVGEGCDVLLDEDDPHLKLESFFPCPEPAYGTLQRGSLMPVQDMLFYRDQLEEANELTGRIHALSEAVKVRGFYPAGAGEIGDAIEAALKAIDNRQIMVPISNWAAFGNGAAKDSIVWLPIDMVVSTIAQLVSLRKEVVSDIYQVSGLSDIMRGETDANETLGAQQLKTQYGSVRIRDKQAELARVARDLVRIAAEIMAEEFSSDTLLEMTQLEIPTDAEIAKQVAQVKQQTIQQAEQQTQQLAANPQAQQNPEQVQQMLAQATQQAAMAAQAKIAELEQTPTVEKVMKFLRDNKTRPFVLDVETDSTIQADENAEKQRRAEFLSALAPVLGQLSTLVAGMPEATDFAVETLKFATAPFRAGRSLEGAIDELGERLKARGQQGKPNPEAEAAQAKLKGEQARVQTELQLKQADMQVRQQEAQLKAQIESAKADAEINLKTLEYQGKQQELQARLQQISVQSAQQTEKHMQDMQKGELELEKLALEIQRVQVGTVADVERARIDAANSNREPMQPNGAVS